MGRYPVVLVRQPVAVVVLRNVLIGVVLVVVNACISLRSMRMGGSRRRRRGQTRVLAAVGVGGPLVVVVDLTDTLHGCDSERESG